LEGNRTNVGAVLLFVNQGFLRLVWLNSNRPY
jgi:hypothetical protein